jgi:hypothetical protein
MRPAPLRSLDQMRLEHTQLRQIGLAQEQVGQPLGHVLGLEWPCQADAQKLGQAEEEPVRVDQFLSGLLVAEFG